MSEQTVTCEGCGSKWVLVGVDNQIGARLVECPLCIDEKSDDYVEGSSVA